jgi:hypothetical protein
MGWTAGHLKGPFTARAAIEFDLGAEFAQASRGSTLSSAGVPIATAKTVALGYVRPWTYRLGRAADY